MALQHTIGKPVSITGCGLHTGTQATITLNPAPENFGIRFIRKNNGRTYEILADIDNVVDVKLGTTIGVEDIKIYTIEHLMSALSGLQIDNCSIDMDGEEVPVLDGSALPFVDIIQKAGIVEQAAQREFLVIDKPMWLYNKEDVALSVFPADHFHITLMVDYKHPAIGAQHTTMFSLDDYSKEFAPARTFCFLSWVEKIREEGLIKGGTPDSAVIVQDVPVTKKHIDYLKKLFNIKGPIKEGQNGFLNNTKLRFYNELCRHKAVDLLGDLYLLGKPLSAHVLAARTGHASNIELARKIREYINKRDKKRERAVGAPPVSYEEILDILPHRYPFLFVDGVEKIEPGKSITAIKNVSFNDNFFRGHFPDNPVMPGVLEIEAMAQAGGIMALYGRRGVKDSAVYFMGIDKAKFRDVVRPGDCLRIECDMLQSRRNTLRFAGKCFVGNRMVCEAEMLAMIGKRGDER